ncbi:GHMP kinase [Saccharothrix australiensis]|uniref:Threonine kinase n=1 Tax=Saccharothrix australiensis TaxID=2072 RepID=A0A495VZS0_9PSEU|nr:GHMP kinase [Saccharothrix australiensis]RKT54380.1 threonine kinase [Saccharothrix australiensis]
MPHPLGAPGPPVAPVRRTGHGRAPAHHGEILQGVFEDAGGRLRHGLVTLPMPGHGSRASFTPHDAPGVTVEPAGLAKSTAAAELALRHVFPADDRPRGGVLRVAHDVTPAVGLGSSTSDVVATIRAVADCAGVRLPEAAVARLAVAAERASDPIMVEDRVVLFAQRDGVVVETLGPRLPPLVVVGVDTDGSGLGIDTLSRPPARYEAGEVAAFRVLRAALRQAVLSGDAALLGRVATASSRVNQRFGGAAGFAELVEVCRAVGGVGVQVAHSGTVAGVLFDGTAPAADLAERVDRCERLLARRGLAHRVTFATPGRPHGHRNPASAS